MDKSSNEAYLYQISTNPIHQNGTLLSMHDQDTGFGFGGELSIVTGMNNSLETTMRLSKIVQWCIFHVRLTQQLILNLGWLFLWKRPCIM